MGNKKGTTFSIIKQRVGEGGLKSGDDVKRVNQLLRMAKLLESPEQDDWKWSDKSARALLNLQKNLTQFGDPVPYIDPHPAGHKYDLLVLLALNAGVLIHLPNKLRSASAMLAFFDHCRTKNYPYRWVPGDRSSIRMIWGFEGRPKWAISTDQDKFFVKADPIALNCTSFANLMMSVWITGNAHSNMYDASQHISGVDDLMSLRYDMRPLNDNNLLIDGYCYDLETLKKLDRNRMYFFASCYDDTGGVKHEMILYNGDVYECNKCGPPAVYKTPLDRKFNEIMGAHDDRGGRAVRVAGPAPF